MIQNWFKISTPVSRKFYVCSGLFLMAVKIGFEGFLFWRVTGLQLPFSSYFLPFTSGAFFSYYSHYDSLMVLRVASSLLCMWIGLCMSIRRSVTAGHSPWLGLGFLIPYLNYLFILFLSVMPDQQSVLSESEFKRFAPNVENRVIGIKSALQSVALSVGLGLTAIPLSIYGFENYSMALFVGLPVFIGVLSAYHYNKAEPRQLSKTFLVGQASLLMLGLGMLLLAVEGLICVLMAAPIAAVLVLLGSLLGYHFANWHRQSQLQIFLGVLLLPIWMTTEALLPSQALTVFPVTTVVEVDAPIATVWEQVIHFPEIQEPPTGILAMGLAYPMRARLQGEGVGAVRYCEFSTGAFVEPITVWNPPTVLGFSVTEQPDPMIELSPYKNVKAPHLKTSFQSVRGEFRLSSITDQRTLLEGTTWYQLDIAPNLYWKLWSDALVHKIHERVLVHIKKNSEM